MYIVLKSHKMRAFIPPQKSKLPCRGRRRCRRGRGRPRESVWLAPPFFPPPIFFRPCEDQDPGHCCCYCSCCWVVLWFILPYYFVSQATRPQPAKAALLHQFWSRQLRHSIINIYNPTPRNAMFVGRPSVRLLLRHVFCPILWFVSVSSGQMEVTDEVADMVAHIVANMVS